MEQRYQDGAGAGAQIGDAQVRDPQVPRPRAVAVDQGERRFDHRLGVRARHQHRRSHLERQSPEFLDARDAGHRFAREPARGQRLDAGDFGVTQRPLAVVHQARMVEPEHMADEQARIEIGAVDSARAKPCRKGPPHRCDAQVSRRAAGDGHARAPSASASSEAWCSVTSASMISSSASPSITWGSL